MTLEMNSNSTRNFIDHPFHHNKIYNEKESKISETFEQIKNVQRIIIFINGNSRFPGKNIIFDCHKYKYLRDFLLELAKVLPRDMNFGKGIQRLFTPRGKHTVKSLDELKDGNAYVCAGLEPFRNIKYHLRFGNRSPSNNTNSPHWTAPSLVLNLSPLELRAVNLALQQQPEQKNPVSNTVFTSHATQPTNLPPLQVAKPRLTVATKANHMLQPDWIHYTKRTARCIDPICPGFGSNNQPNQVITRVPKTLRLLPSDGKTVGSRVLTFIRPNLNGVGKTALKVLLSRRAVQTLGQVICDISEAFGPRWNNDPIRHLYTLTGREVRSVNELFRQQKLFIATGMQRLFGPGPVFSRSTRSTAMETASSDEGESVLFDGEDVRTILREFWPNHLDPDGVVAVWEKRVARTRRAPTRETAATATESCRDPIKAPAPASNTEAVGDLRNETHMTPTVHLSALSSGAPRSISRMEQRDSGFDESILVESKPASQAATSACQPDGLDVQEDLKRSMNKVTPSGKEESPSVAHYLTASNEMKNKSKDYKSCNMSESMIKRPQPTWKCTLPPGNTEVSMSLGKITNQKTRRSRNQSIEHFLTGKPTSKSPPTTKRPPQCIEMGTAVEPHSTDPVSDRLHCAGVPSFRLPDRQAFVGLHNRSLGMHPTNKWSSPFKVGPPMTWPNNTDNQPFLNGSIQHLPRIDTSKALHLTTIANSDSNTTQTLQSNRYTTTYDQNNQIKPTKISSGVNPISKTQQRNGAGSRREPFELTAIPEPRELSLTVESKSIRQTDRSVSVELRERTNNPPSKIPLSTLDTPKVMEKVETHRKLPALVKPKILATMAAAVKTGTELSKSKREINSTASAPGIDALVQKIPSTGNVTVERRPPSPDVPTEVLPAAVVPVVMPTAPPVSSVISTAALPPVSTDTKRQSVTASLNIPMVSDSGFLEERYHIGRTLGDGNFAVVRLARRRDTGQHYAIKMIDKTKLKGKESMLFHEVTIMHQCNHPNIVRLFEEFETPKEIWLAMEFVKDGDLFDGITKALKFSEVTASGIVSDLANALFYLHCRSIVHRDLKPENVLLYRQADGKIRVKLADFGLALEVRRDLRTICGTPTYIAPEILNERGYGLEVDMWALGVITYIMLCGFAPFRSPDRSQSKLFEAIKRGMFVYLSPYWDPISKGAKDLINRLLVISPKRRLTALETLVHPWVFGEGVSRRPEDFHPSSTFEQRRLAFQTELENQANMVALQQSKIQAHTGGGPVERTFPRDSLPAVKTDCSRGGGMRTNLGGHDRPSVAVHLPSIAHDTRKPR